MLKNEFFTQLLEEEKIHNAYEKAFKDIGINVYDSCGSSKDIIEVLTELAIKLKGVIK